ncbi:MAG: hypothetical protein IJ336_10860 [Lachnospiraceae bacterium]|nr:hypothetical protein [Lachnospiraceae bacterium]
MGNNFVYEQIYIIGSGQLAYDCALIGKKYIDNVKVFELKVTESTVLEKLCEKSRIFYTTVSTAGLTEYLKKEKHSTLIVSAASVYLLPEEIIGMDNYTIINWHNALLPKHKGRNAEVWAIYEGDAATGVTWHYITGQIDGGDILCQEEIAITETTTAMSLYRQQISLGKEMFESFCENLLRGACGACKQVDSGEESMHFSKQRPNGGVLDLTWNIHKISGFLRAMDYGSLLLMGKMKIKLQDKFYEFYRYKIKTAEESIEHREVIVEEGILTIKEKDTIIIIKGLQEIQ